MKHPHSRRWAWLFALPFSVGFLLFQMLPVGLNFVQTLYLGPRFVGLSNYAAVLGSSSFQLALGNTARYLLLALPLGMVLSLLLALVVFRYWRHSALLQASFLFPLAVPCAVTVALLRLFFQEDGVANAALRQLGLPQQDWLASAWAFCILLGLYLWKNLGYNIILLLAGLSAVPESCLEAARVDGASGWQRFRFIIAPLLKPQLYFVLLVSLANAFKNFREMLLLGGDTPDTDFVVRVTDVDENGRSIKLADGLLSARYRNGFARSEFLQEGEIVCLKIRTTKLSNCFRKGHRIRVTVTSSAKNFIFPNSNTREGFASARTVVAHNRVYHGGLHASRLTVRVEP